MAQKELDEAISDCYAMLQYPIDHNNKEEISDWRKMHQENKVQLHYSLSWSGGKDSTASIILAHEHNEPLDSIIFCEVMYDLKNNISGETHSI